MEPALVERFQQVVQSMRLESADRILIVGGREDDYRHLFEARFHSTPEIHPGRAFEYRAGADQAGKPESRPRVCPPSWHSATISTSGSDSQQDAQFSAGELLVIGNNVRTMAPVGSSGKTLAAAGSGIMVTPALLVSLTNYIDASQQYSLTCVLDSVPESHQQFPRCEVLRPIH